MAEFGKGVQEKEQAAFSDNNLVAFCGINCKECKARSQRRLELAKQFKASLQELPLDVFKQILPPFKNIDEVMSFLDFLPMLSGSQTCCTFAGQPCGDPNCAIRTCVKNKGYRTCAECSDYKVCSKLDFLKPHHKTLIADLDFIQEQGFDQYVAEVIAKYELKPLS